MEWGDFNQNKISLMGSLSLHSGREAVPMVCFGRPGRCSGVLWGLSTAVEMAEGRRGGPLALDKLRRREPGREVAARISFDALGSVPHVFCAYPRLWQLSREGIVTLLSR